MPPRALSRGQATPACLRRWSRAVRRGREAGDSGPAATPGHGSEVAPEIETRGQTRGRAGPSLWAARDGDVAGLTPGPVQRHPARASGRTPASVPPENRKRVLSGDRTGPGRAGWGRDAAQTRMVTSWALAEDPSGCLPCLQAPAGRSRDSSQRPLASGTDEPPAHLSPSDSSSSRPRRCLTPPVAACVGAAGRVT